jgi:hypothetical protein
MDNMIQKARLNGIKTLKDSLFIGLILMFLLNIEVATTTTTTVTTTINPVQIFFYSFTIPFFSIILLILAFFLMYETSKNIPLGLLASALVSYILWLPPLNLIDFGICGFVTILFALSFVYEIFKPKKKR